MLVLARKLHQKIIIGDNIVIQVLRKSRDVVKLGIQAPLSVSVHRQEVYEEIQRGHQKSGSKKAVAPPPLSPETQPESVDPVPTH